jgi:hypothetical protein
VDVNAIARRKIDRAQRKVFGGRRHATEKESIGNESGHRPTSICKRVACRKQARSRVAARGPRRNFV